MANSSLDNVNELLRLVHGDKGRLEDIKRRLENGQALYISDNNYLQQLVNQYRGEIQKIIEFKTPEPIPEPEPTPEPTPEPEPIPEPTTSKKKSNKDKKHCSSCDAIVENSAEFCSSCGKVLEDTLKQEAERMEHTNEWKKMDRKVSGIGLTIVGIFILLAGFGILQGAVNMPQIIAGQYILLALFVLVIGVMTIYAGRRVSRKKKGQYLCIYCRYIAETDRELHNHELRCDRKLKHDELNK